MVGKVIALDQQDGNIVSRGLSGNCRAIDSPTDHKKLNVFDTSVPSGYLEWGPPLLPIIAPENFCDVVTVQPAARSGGINEVKPRSVAP